MAIFSCSRLRSAAGCRAFLKSRPVWNFGPADLALALLGMPVGILSMLPVAGRVVSHIGGKATVIAGFFVFSVIVLSTGLLSHTPVEFFIALTLLGIAMSTLELG